MIIRIPSQSRSALWVGRGFLIIDAVIGITIALMLLMALTVAVIRQQQGERRLAQTRLAARELEAAMFTLQGGAALDSTSVRVERLNEPAPPGRMWVRLTWHQIAPSIVEAPATQSASGPAITTAPVPAASQVTLVGLVPLAPPASAPGGAP